VLYRFFLHGLAKPLAFILFRPKVYRLDKVPAAGPAIVAGNHLGTGESFIVPAYLKRPMSWTAKMELFTKKSLWGRFSGWFLKLINCVPLDREGGATAAGAIHSVESVLAAGGLVGISPEGTRSPDGRLYRFHTGVARMALDSGAPVVPYACHNTRFRKGWLPFPWLYQPTVTFGDPIPTDPADIEAYRNAPDRAASGKVLRDVTERIRETIQAMTGQEYVDEYSTKRQKKGAGR